MSVPLDGHLRAATIRLFRRAATAARDDAGPLVMLSNEWRTAIADVLDSEAATQGEMPALVDVLNVAIEQKSGVRSYLEIGRTEAGDIAMSADTTEAHVVLARLILGEGP